MNIIYIFGISIIILLLILNLCLFINNVLMDKTLEELRDNHALDILVAYDKGIRHGKNEVKEVPHYDGRIKNCNRNCCWDGHRLCNPDLDNDKL